MTTTPRPSRVFGVGIICALATEKAAVVAMLDQEYERRARIPGDENDYTLGRMCGHDVAVACLPAGIMGKASAATVARDMMRSFPIKIGLMVGIAGGVWSKSRDIRLGDVVVSQPEGMHGGVVQYDFGKMERDGVFRRTGTLNKPPRILLGALQSLKTQEMMEGTPILQHIADMANKYPKMGTLFRHQGLNNDQLYDSVYHHHIGESCQSCDATKLVQRSRRDDLEPRVHYGNIASGDEVVKDGPTRDLIAQRENIICFEMEAAGLTDSFPCIVIRGICDYADSHKNKRWQPYAAATAAAYAKWLLSSMEISQVVELPTISATNYDVPFSLEGVPATSRFIGREGELSTMETNLLLPETSQKRRNVFVIHGMGGIGKTQLAIEYARRHSANYSAIIWINGDSKAQLHQSLLDFLQRLPKSQLSPATAAVLEQPVKGTVVDDSSIDDKYDLVADETIRWLSQASNDRWLMIVDNVDREHESGSRSPVEPAFSNIIKLFPAVDHGAILVTTRLISLKSQFRNGLKLREMNAADAKAILGHLSEEPASIDELVQRLNGLPLALAQASAFIEQTGMSVTAYIKQYDDKWTGLMHLQERFPLQEYGERSILTTWTISYEQAQNQNKAAALLLKLWAVLDCNDLWYEIVKSALRFEVDSQAPQWLKTLAEDELAFMDATGLLNKLSLVDRKGSYEDNSGYAIHSVLHNWCLYLCDEAEKDLLLWLAVRLVGGSVPSGRSSNYRSVDRRLLPQVAQLCRQLERSARGAQTRAEITSLIDITGVLIRQNKLGDARTMASRTLDAAETILGLEDPVTFSAVHHMAWVYTELGSFTGAAGLYKRALQGKGKIYGPSHPSTLKTLRNFGHLLLRQGKHTEANQLYLDALTSMESSPGPKGSVHSDILDSLGFTYVSLKSTSKAKEMYGQALRTKEELLGVNHISTLDTVSNLALLLMKDDDLGESERLLRRALLGRERSLGQDHPDTISTLRHLGTVLARLDRTDEASGFLNRALDASTKHFGPDHMASIDIRADMNALATSTESQPPSPVPLLSGPYGDAASLGPEDRPLKSSFVWRTGFDHVDGMPAYTGNASLHIEPSEVFSPLLGASNITLHPLQSGPDNVTPQFIDPDVIQPLTGLQVADPMFPVNFVTFDPRNSPTIPSFHEPAVDQPDDWFTLFPYGPSVEESSVEPVFADQKVSTDFLVPELDISAQGSFQPLAMDPSQLTWFPNDQNQSSNSRPQ